MPTERSTAFVPGHVTAFFSIHRGETPASTGSRGAGITLSSGVEVTVAVDETGTPSGDGSRNPSDNASGKSSSNASGNPSGNASGNPSSVPPRSQLTMNGTPATVGAVDDVLDALGVNGRVSITTELPVGAGFGVSGAAALGAAIAANDAAGRARSENDLVRLAHEAEVRRGTGLGDVVAQARGGIPIRVEPGAPGYGVLDGVPVRSRVEYISFGELSTEEVLAGETGTLSSAGELALRRLRADPRLPTLMAAARDFASDAGILVPEVEVVIEEVDAAGGSAAMAMLGRTVFAVGTGLSDAGYDPDVCHTHAAGASLIEE